MLRENVSGLPLIPTLKSYLLESVPSHFSRKTIQTTALFSLLSQTQCAQLSDSVQWLVHWGAQSRGRSLVLNFVEFHQPNPLKPAACVPPLQGWEKETNNGVLPPMSDSFAKQNCPSYTAREETQWEKMTANISNLNIRMCNMMTVYIFKWSVQLQCLWFSLSTLSSKEELSDQTTKVIVLLRSRN